VKVQCCNIKKKAVISGVKNGYFYFICAHTHTHVYILHYPKMLYVYFTFIFATTTSRPTDGGVVLCLLLSVDHDDGISQRETFSS